MIIEKLPQIPAKPPKILIDRWLPYKKVKRRVILNKPEPTPLVQKPQNLIIEWQMPEPIIKRRFINLGVVKADPIAYEKKYSNLTVTNECKL